MQLINVCCTLFIFRAARLLTIRSYRSPAQLAYVACDIYFYNCRIVRVGQRGVNWIIAVGGLRRDALPRSSASSPLGSLHY